MYQNLTILNFRGFKRFVINDFKRVNLISGMNDSGKTTLLEALFIHGGKNNPRLIFTINSFRGIEFYKIHLESWSEMPWDSLFYKKDISNQIEISGMWESKERRIDIKSRSPNNGDTKEVILSDPKDMYKRSDTLESVNYQELEFIETFNDKVSTYSMKVSASGIIVDKLPNPDFPTYFISGRRISTREDAELFGKLDVRGEIDEITKILRIIEPRLKRLSVVFVNEEPVIHGDIGIGKLLPIAYMGDGLGRLLSLVLRISNAEKGIVLIDEIENGLHYSVYEKVWRAINDVSRTYDVQIFATTHSYECIKYSHSAFKNDSEDFVFFRLDRNKDDIIVKRYDKEKIEYALDTDIEVR